MRRKAHPLEDLSPDERMFLGLPHTASLDQLYIAWHMRTAAVRVPESAEEKEAFDMDNYQQLLRIGRKLKHLMIVAS